MPKFLIDVSLETYIRYVAECASDQEAQERGIVDFREGHLSSLIDRDITVHVEQVDDDTPEGDA